MRVIVLGMHKSGTTLISKSLHRSGINMIGYESEKTYDQGNKFERIECVLTNVGLLDVSFETHSLKITPPAKNKKINSLLSSYVDTLVEDLNKTHGCWGFKDPRTVLTYKFWNQKISDHKLICIYRSPIELINHYQRSSKYRSINIIKSISTLKTWYKYNSLILSFHTTEKNSILINYNSFMERQSSVTDLSTALKYEIKDMRDLSLKRSSNEKSFITKLSILILKYILKIDVLKLYNNLNTNKTI